MEAKFVAVFFNEIRKPIRWTAPKDTYEEAVAAIKEEATKIKEYPSIEPFAYAQVDKVFVVE